MTQSQDLDSAGTSAERSYSAAEIGKELGRTDKWVRNQRATLEKIYYWCVGDLKTPENLYTQFAFDEIRKLQLNTSSAVPVIKDGKTVYARNKKAKLTRINRKMSVQAYAQAIWESHGRPAFQTPLEGDEEADNSVEVPVEVVVEEDPEMHSIQLAFNNPERSTDIELLDDVGSISGDMQSTMANFKNFLTQGGRQVGRELGAIYGQSLAVGFQESMNQAVSDVTNVVQPEKKANTTRKGTRKEG